MTALAGFLGSKNLSDEGVQILFQTWPQQVATPIANEIHNVLTQTRSGLLTIGVILSIYFSSNGVEAVRIGLNRAYDVRDSGSWWLLRLESIAYVFVGALSLLTLAFLVIFAPLIWAAVLLFARAPHDMALVITSSWDTSLWGLTGLRRCSIIECRSHLLSPARVRLRSEVALPKA